MFCFRQFYSRTGLKGIRSSCSVSYLAVKYARALTIDTNYARGVSCYESTHVNEHAVLAILTSTIRATVRSAVQRISAERSEFF